MLKQRNVECHNHLNDPNIVRARVRVRVGFVSFQRLLLLFLIVSFRSHFILCGTLFGRFLIYRFMAGQFIWPQHLNLLPHGSSWAHILLVCVFMVVVVVVIVIIGLCHQVISICGENFEHGVDFSHLAHLTSNSHRQL